MACNWTIAFPYCPKVDIILPLLSQNSGRIIGAGIIGKNAIKKGINLVSIFTLDILKLFKNEIVFRINDWNAGGLK